MFVTPRVHIGAMKESRHHLLAERASRQHGLFTRRDARACGIPDATISNGVRSGRYRQALPGVYAIAGSPDTLYRRMMANVLSMPTLAAISHRTAAEMWGLTTRGQAEIDVVTHRWDRVSRSDVSIHESKDLIDEDITSIGGIPVTNAARTIVDLGAVSPRAVEWAFEAGIRLKRFTLAEVEALVARVGRKGRRGVGVIRPVLETRKEWDSVTESALEDFFRRVIDEMGIPQPRPQYVVRDHYDVFVCRADFAYPDHRLLIALDGQAYHTDQSAFRRDRSKQNSAMILGWNVLRYTWWDLKDDPDRVGWEIRSALGLTPRSGTGS